MKEKIKNICQRHENLIVLILIIVATSTFCFNIEFRINDEFWNFSNVYKMTNGHTIYKDLNVIITPLFFYIGEILFKILGSNYITFRLYNLIISTTLYFTIYQIFRALNINKTKSILHFLITYIFTYQTILIGANYNILALVLCLIGIKCILKEKKEYIQGILIFLIFMTKQNIGVYYVIGYIIYQFTQNKDIKIAIKNILKTGIITIVPTIVYILYLLINQNLYNFINYAFLGIGEFGSKNYTYDKSIYILPIYIMAYLLMIWILKSKKLKIEEKIKKQGKILISFSLPMLMIVYPIVNEIHLIIAGIPTIITLIFIFEKTLIGELTSSLRAEKIIKIISKGSIVAIAIFNIWMNSSYCKSIYNDSKDIYYGANIEKSTREKIDIIVEYIRQQESEGKQVKILSYYSNLYMNVLNNSNGKFDLPFYGNLGREGEEGLIEEIKELKNTNILIKKETEIAYQETKRAKEYVKENYEQIGEIGDFYIYKVGY